MIVYKRWETLNRIGRHTHNCDGWFLFGVIPLYVRKIAR